MKLCLFFIAIIATSQAASIVDVALEKWNEFKAEFKKVYNDQDELNRMKTFLGSYWKVKAHNEVYEKGLVSYKLSLNKFADIPHEELSRTLHGYASDKRLSGDKNDDDSDRVFVPRTNVTIPDSVNWIEKGAVTPVKNQADCGSCWAFSSTGALEAQHFLKTGKLVSLSEQNLIDCTGVRDCIRGGFMEDAFNYVKKNDGIDTEDSYPYEAEIKTCRYNPKTRGADDTGFVVIESGNEEHLKAAVATVGPISVGIDAKHESFHLYTEGIYHEPTCSKTNLNHAVLIVGYGTDENGKDYWLVKNSWNEDWGEKGYIRMIRNENVCGIANEAVYPVV